MKELNLDKNLELSSRLYETISKEKGQMELNRIKSLPVFKTLDSTQKDFLCRVFLEANAMGAFFCLDMIEGNSLCADGKPLDTKILVGKERAIYMSDYFMEKIQEEFPGNP